MTDRGFRSYVGVLICRVTSGALLRIAAGVLFGASMLAVFVAQQAQVRTLVGPDGVVAGRDFLVFYAAGRLVDAGQGRQLYDAPAQKRVQDEILAPRRRSGVSFFTNPASVAVAYAPLSRLGYLRAFYLHTVLMAAVFVVGVWVLCRRLPALGRHRLLITVLGLSWAPMLNAVTGGQNSAVTFALLSAAYVWTVERRRWAAGAALGLLFFKPQYALPVLGLLLLRKEFIICFTAALVALTHYVIGSLFCGWDWPVRMLSALQFFVAAERVANGPKLISIAEWLDHTLVGLFGSEVDPDVLRAGARVMSLTLVVGLIAYLVIKWRGADPRRADFGLYWALVVAATLLISPHTQHYEVSILALPVLLILDWMRRNEMAITPALRVALLVGFLAYPIFLLSPVLRFQPLILFPLAVTGWAAWSLQQRRRSESLPSFTVY